MENIAQVIPLIVMIVALAGLWKVFAKAGEPGWACIVPIYNMIVLLNVAGRPVWWFILMFVPIVNFIVLLVVWIDIAKRFGKGTGFGLGLVFLGPIFIPILGFGDAQYIGGDSV
ncbi:hypothetical protein PPSIR1_26358 [Plesiocystis pacifica SIR-1]|uniref:Signal peptidase I n=1 Tax=Plesiocystis pacifica SIR-1 TaxID=391625 RepID=A6G9Y2_9BACT|nr:DUF5684 domain-containing protein [Plesiocystis pacifica]EDM77307.1 hypothetical protein PPSIR1_26358 [Plesiocystis pacifica SIR-1]